jgi:hypothetical protein
MRAKRARLSSGKEFGRRPPASSAPMRARVRIGPCGALYVRSSEMNRGCRCPGENRNLSCCMNPASSFRACGKPWFVSGDVSTPRSGPQARSGLAGGSALRLLSQRRQPVRSGRQTAPRPTCCAVS